MSYFIRILEGVNKSQEGDIDAKKTMSRFVEGDFIPWLMNFVT